jgi:hypothetical protein
MVHRNFPQTWTEQLDMPDVHASLQEWLDQPGPVERLQHRRLQRRPTRLVVRRGTALDDAWPDAMAQ